MSTPANHLIFQLPEVHEALAFAREVTAGETIDAAPAIKHATTVAAEYLRYGADPQLAITALCHDVPDYLDEPGMNLFRTRFGERVFGLVSGLQVTHRLMDNSTPEDFVTGMRALDAEHPGIAIISGVDKVIAMSSMYKRGDMSGVTEGDDGLSFWTRRQAFFRAVPRIAAFVEDFQPDFPAQLNDDLATLVETGQAKAAQYKLAA